jgi:hypothetical protein
MAFVLAADSNSTWWSAQRYARRGGSRHCRRVAPPRNYAIVALVLIAASMGAMAQAQPADVETACAAEARATFEELMSEYRNVLRSLGIPFEFNSTSYQPYYSAKIGRCLLLVDKTVTVLGEPSTSSYLIEANSRRMYALYVEAKGRMESCTLIPSVKTTSDCKDRFQFDAFVSNYTAR